MVVGKLLHIFEIPLHGSGLALPEEMMNSLLHHVQNLKCMCGVVEGDNKGLRTQKQDDKAFDYGLI